MLRALLTATAAAIVVLDLGQVVLLGKGLGAIGGAVIYAGVAIGAWRERVFARIVALLMPAIPLAVFAGLMGGDVRENLVDTGMIVVFCFQLLAGVLAALGLWGRRASDEEQMG